jgi:hypothetical protein
VTAPPRRLVAIARTVAWAALLSGAAACVAIIGLASLDLELSARSRWPGLGALALCVGAAFVLDDPASATVDASPTSLARRRMLRIALVLPLLCGVWAASLWYATSADGAPFGPHARGALTVQFGAMLAVTLGASAAALRLMPSERGGWTGVIALFALLGAAFYLPRRWALLAAPSDNVWHAAQQRWALLLALGVLALAWANRDPAARRHQFRRPPTSLTGGT